MRKEFVCCRWRTALLYMTLVVLLFARAWSAPLPTRWMSPYGPRPAAQLPHFSGPLRLQQLATTTMPLPPSTPGQGRLCVVVNSAIYTTIAGDVAQYVQDLQGEGYSVIVFQYTSGTAEQLRAYLKSLYDAPDSLTGTVLIGNIPYIVYEMMQDWGSGPVEYEDFPCDLFYADLNGVWSDTLENGQVHANNGKYDTRSGERNLEIWVSRLKADNLSMGTETALLHNYFLKLHCFRNGTLHRTLTALAYDDDDWDYMTLDDLNDLALLYHNTAVIGISADETTTANDYKVNRLPVNQEMIALRSHGYAQGHGFYRANKSIFDYVYVPDYLSSLPPALFYSFFVCSGCDYSLANNLGGSVIFQTSTGLVDWGSTKTGGMWAQTPYYQALANGATFGDAFKTWLNTAQHDNPTLAPQWWYGMVILGDATLRPATPPHVPPTAIVDSYTANENTTLTVLAPGVLGNDRNPESFRKLTATVVANPTHGTLTLAADGGFTYTPEHNYVGGDSFTYKVDDGLIDSNVATVTLIINPTGYEADLAPRPDGNNKLTISDWVQCGRFAVELDTPTSPSEFQCADCAPLSTKGDGKITTADWVQAGRYVAGLDPLTPAGGPTMFTASGVTVAPASRIQATAPAVRTNRAVSLPYAVITRGTVSTVPVMLTAQGDESALGFSLHFDPKRVKFVGAKLAGTATTATMNVNAAQAAQGDISLVLMLPLPHTFPAGKQPVVNLLFQALSPGITTLTFHDRGAAREVDNSSAAILPATFSNGMELVRR